MLVVTRRPGETIIIGNDIKITVLGVQGNQVRIGVKAPRQISVHRHEIYKRIQENQALEESNEPSSNIPAKIE